MCADIVRRDILAEAGTLSDGGGRMVALPMPLRPGTVFQMTAVPIRGILLVVCFCRFGSFLRR